jgi:hypothetical protein
MDRSNGLTAVSFPVFAGNDRGLVARCRLHSTGSRFRSPKADANGLAPALVRQVKRSITILHRRGAPIIDLPRMGPVIKGAVLHVSYRIICAELTAPTVRLRSPPEWGSLVTRMFGEGRYPVRSQPTQAAISCE